jgi:hypothetical protein
VEELWVIFLPSISKLSVIHFIVLVIYRHKANYLKTQGLRQQALIFSLFSWVESTHRIARSLTLKTAVSPSLDWGNIHFQAHADEWWQDLVPLKLSHWGPGFLADCHPEVYLHLCHVASPEGSWKCGSWFSSEQTHEWTTESTHDGSQSLSTA